MNIEAYLIAYLGETLDVSVYGEVPDLGTAAEFVTVEKTGGALADHICSATIAVQSWAESRAAAAELNEIVKTAMAGATARPEISRCHLSNDYNYPELASKRPRYQAVFDVVYFL